MEPTLQLSHHRTAVYPNLDEGDVVLCGSSRAGVPAGPGLDGDRVALRAPLDARSDLEWLLRTLLRRPNVRHVVLCGDDSRAAGEALVALWRAGFDREGRVPGPRGHLSPDLDGDMIEALRADVTLSDLRDRPLDEVTRAVAALPALGPDRDPVTVPDPGVARRKVFLSRTTSFPIFTSDVADGWLQLLNLTLRIGTAKESADGEGLAEALNAVVTIETPVLEDGEAEGREEFPDFLDFTGDDFERRYVPRAGERLRDWGGVDQLAAACDRLRQWPDSQSATMVLLDPGEPLAGENAPDLISLTFNVVDGKLFATSVLRRCDVYTEWPLQAAALLRVQQDAAARLGLEVGSAVFVIHSATLRDLDFARSTRVLADHFLRPLPLHVDPSGVFLFGSDAEGARAMLLNHDASEILWEDAFEDPEDLSWYIVDVMPWLLPQHIRYVGQECASLMRAIEVGECYLQG